MSPCTMNAPGTGSISNRSIPTPDADEILIRVIAAGVNGPDIAQRKGLYPPPPGASDLSGLEVSGTIADCGTSVDKNLIAFTAAVAGGFQIAVYNRRMGQSEILTSVPGSAVEPEWLSDGRHILFTQKHKGKKRLMILDSRSKKISMLHRPDFGETSSATFVY